MTLFWCLNITPMTINERTNKLDFIKTKMSALQNTMSRALEDKPQTGRKYLQKIHLIKDCYLKYTKNSKIPQDETKTLTDTSPRKMQMANKHGKNASRHLWSGKCKLKQQQDATALLIERPNSRTSTTPNTCEDLNTASGTIHCGGGVNTIATAEDSLVVSYKIKLTLTIESGIHCSLYLPRRTETFYLHKTLQGIFTVTLFIVTKTWKPPKFNHSPTFLQ